MSDNGARVAPTQAMIVLLAPDGYYAYLGVPKPNNNATAAATTASGSDGGVVDLELVKKNYRKLSIKHHPDKPGGDADTFRMLKRAQMVLSNPKLRHQYDILGLDLDDDDDLNHHHHQDESKDGADGTGEDGDQQTTSQGIIHEIASMALTAVMQMGVRTVVLGLISLVVVRYRLTLFPALAFLAFIAFRIHSERTSTTLEVSSPFLIGIGLIIMYQASSGSWSNGDGSLNWLLYWLGESIVICMFTYNSFATKPTSTAVTAGVLIFGILVSLWFRGKFWNYAVVVGLEVFLAIFIAVSFPVFEMILEAILNDKLKKVGDKVRAHHEYMERYYQSKR